jgi:hypothetical protein
MQRHDLAVLGIALLGALALGACATAQTTQQPATTQPESAPARGHGMQGGKSMHDMDEMCPMRVEGTTAHAEDVPGGAALVFTTTGDVAELRRRAARMAAMHNQHHSASQRHMAQGSERGAGPQAGHGPHGDKQGSGGMMGDHAGMMMMMSATQARAEDITSGARIVFTPVDPTQLDALRQHLQRHAQQMMSSSACPMMAEMSPDAPVEPAGSEPAEHEAHHPQGGN